MGVSRHRLVAKGQEMYRNKKRKHVKGVHSFCFCSSNMQNLCILQGPSVAACVCVFTFSAKLEEWAYHVTD